MAQVAPDGEHVALVTGLEPVQLLELSSGKTLWTSRLPGNHAPPAFTSDGKKKIIYCARAQAIIVSDLMSTNPAIACGGSTWLTGLAVSRGDRFVAAAGSNAREVLLWDLSYVARPIRVWANLTPKKVIRVAFAPDGRRLLSAHDDGTICVFTVPQDIPVWRGFPPLAPDWLARTGALPADQQVEEVTAELARRNPGFNDPLQVVKDGEGRVVKASVRTSQLEDLSPLRAFGALRELNVLGKEENSKVSDLSCLRGMRLTDLSLPRNRIWDVSPLHDMPLTRLELGGNPLYDLSPLQGKELRNIDVCHTNVDDLSPLRGMPPESAILHGTFIKDLSPLSKAPLKFISTSAPDLEPLRDLPLEGVHLWWGLGNYKPEQIKMLLRIPTLKGLTLFGKCDPEQLKEFRGNPLLKTINDKPAAEFWKGEKKPPAPKNAG
jgi:WD40 repeat protein